ncbi:condensation domain-containing protein [Plantactinospora sp. KLBMP9567]|uniref:condensation domain-containing protein n=1 Tax=Plantactinospora sp. KLBMP9567 TaxID=3085900 RepID=UPI002980B548|nr:condensation domain-containing protein [Plantactinospora sp. KLBMP9567]MDW5329518.1 condensation domain-containing protein [Plantactinospora sp. KLBMP9567]
MFPVQHVPIRFSGLPTRAGPLTRGQANLLRVMLTGTPVCLDAVLPVPRGTEPADVSAAVRVLLARHESLRTTYRVGDVPSQVVAEAGELVMSVVEVAPPITPQLLEDVRRIHWDSPFTDAEQELPFRVAAVSADGVLSHVVLALSHVAADLAALTIVAGELEKLLTGQPLSAPGPQPLDFLTVENGAAMRNRLRTSLRYWETQLRTTPHSLFPQRWPEEDGRLHPGLLVRSAAAAKALDRASRRIGASRSAVALTALVVLVADYVGQPVCPVTMPSANRFLPQTRDYVGQLGSDCFTRVDLRGTPTFDAAARAVRRESIRGYWHGWFDTDELWRLYETVATERGLHAHARELVFNDLSGVGSATARPGEASLPERYGLVGTPVVAADRATGAADGAWARVSPGAGNCWLEAEPSVSRLSVDLYRLDHELTAAFWADPRCFTAAETVALAHAFEALLVAAGDDDLELCDVRSVTGLAPRVQGDDWYPVDSGWVPLSCARRLLADVVGDDSFVAAVPDPRLGHRLIGYLGDGSWTPQAVHSACVAALEDRPGAMTPHTYVICADVPEDRDDWDAWRRQPVRATGTGRADR